MSCGYTIFLKHPYYSEKSSRNELFYFKAIFHSANTRKRGALMMRWYWITSWRRKWEMRKRKTVERNLIIEGLQKLLPFNFIVTHQFSELTTLNTSAKNARLRELYRYNLLFTINRNAFCCTISLWSDRRRNTISKARMIWIWKEIIENESLKIRGWADFEEFRFFLDLH